MPKFNVLRRVDAWIDYVAEFEAENAEQATLVAERSEAAEWRRVGEAEFWNARFSALDERGDELAETVVTRG